MVDLAAQIWRDYNTDGVPGSGKLKPLKSKIREWGSSVEKRFVATRTLLKDLDTTKVGETVLTEPGRSGLFVWRTGNYSTQIAADTQEGVYIKADAIPVTSGAWVREHSGAFNVQWFGAKGDGTSDDTTSIQAAISAADAFSNGTVPSITGYIAACVYFPKGNYLHGGLTSSKPHRFFGDGKGATFLKLKNGANTSFWTHSLPGTGAGPTDNYFQQPIFQDMTWDCNGANQSSGQGLNLPSTAWTITTAYSVGAFVDRLEIYNAKQIGINIGSNRNFGFIKDTTIKGCGDKGIANSAYDWRIYAIDIGSCLYGYSQDAAGGTTIWGANIYLNTEAGININAGVNTYMWFNGCSIDLNQKYGIIINGNNDQETFMVSLDGCRFNGNSSLTDATYADIIATDCYGLSVTNCEFYAQGSNRPPYLIQFSGGGGAFWNSNHYRKTGGTQPWVTAITNDFTKLLAGGDRTASMRLTANDGLRIPKLEGTNTNDSASTGMIGELLSANASTVSMVSATPKTITSISLTAGDWDVSGSFQSNPAGTTTQAYFRASVSLTDNALDFTCISQFNIPVAAGQGNIIPTPVTRISLASTATVYLVAEVSFAVSTLTGTARIRARRAR